MTANHSRKFDLQLFADEDVQNQDGTLENEGTPPDNSGQGGEEEFDEILYNKETIRIPKSQRTTLLQKGYNYDKVKTKADSQDIVLQKLAKATGYESVEAYIQAVEEAARKAEEKRYQESGIDPKIVNELIDSHPAVQQAKQQTEREQWNQEVSELAGRYKKVFGREITQQDVGQDVLDYRNTRKVSLAEAFFFLKSDSITALVEKEKKAAADKALEDYKRQSSRGVETSTDAPIDEKGLDFTAEERNWAETRVKQGHYKNIREAWEWLRRKK